MRIGSVALVCGGCVVAVACGGTSEVQFAPAMQGEAGEGGAGSKGGTGNSGKGGTGNSGKGGTTGDAGRGGSGNAGEATSAGGAAGEAPGTGGTAGDPTTGGSAGEPPGTGGTSDTGGNGGTTSAGGSGGSGGDEGVAGEGGIAGQDGVGGDAGSTGGEGGVGGDAGSTGGEGGEGAQGPVLGRLRVLVSRPAGGSAVEVSVSGPGFANTTDRSTTFSDLPPGEYAVSATPSRVPGPVVSSIYDAVVNGTPATVTGGAQASVSVVYPFRRGGTGRMWATDLATGEVSAFNASRLNDSSTTPGDLRLSITDGANRVLSAIAFDQEGNAWIGDCSNIGDVMKVPTSQLGGSGSVVVTPPVILGPPAQNWARCIVSLEFDSEGSLYATYNSNGIVKWTPDQLQTSATPNSTPAAYFRAANGFSGLQDATFDSDGNLWVSAYTSGRVHKLTPSQLQTTATSLVPAVTWTMPQAEGLAFGPDGKLWIATYDNKLGAYDPSATALPTPARSMTFPDGFGPFAIEFDESGNLWATSFNFGSIARFNAADLTTDGAKIPSLEFTNTGIISGGGLVFNPGRD